MGMGNGMYVYEDTYDLPRIGLERMNATTVVYWPENTSVKEVVVKDPSNIDDPCKTWIVPNETKIVIIDRECASTTPHWIREIDIYYNSLIHPSPNNWNVVKLSFIDMLRKQQQKLTSALPK